MGVDNGHSLIIDSRRRLNLLVVNDLHVLRGVWWPSIVVCPRGWCSLEPLSYQSMVGSLPQVIINSSGGTCVWRRGCRRSHHHQIALRRNVQHHLSILNVILWESVCTCRCHDGVLSCIFGTATWIRGKLHWVARIRTINSRLESSQCHHLSAFFISHHYVCLFDSDTHRLRRHRSLLWILSNWVVLSYLSVSLCLMHDILLLVMMMVMLGMSYLRMSLVLVVLTWLIRCRSLALLTLHGVELLQNIYKHAFLILDISFVSVPDKVHIQTAICWAKTLSLAILCVKSRKEGLFLIKLVKVLCADIGGYTWDVGGLHFA